MTSNISHIKREIASPTSEPKRQKTASSLTDQRIQEILNHRSLIKHHRDLLVRWHEIAGKKIPVQLKRTPQSPKWTVSIDPNDSFIHLAMKMRDYPLTKAVIKEYPQEEHPFSLAISVGDQKIQGLFVRYGLQNADGNTFLHILFGNRIAEGQTSPDFAPFEVVNPDLALENGEGKTCYELAEENYHRKSFRRMMAYMESKGQEVPSGKVLSERALSYRAPPQPDGWIQTIMQEGDFQTLGRFAQASRYARKVAQQVLIQKAHQIGCKGITYMASLQYMIDLKEKLKFFSQKSLDTVHNIPQDEICSYLTFLKGVYIGKDGNPIENPMLNLLALDSTWKNHGMVSTVWAEMSAQAVCYAVLYDKLDLLKQLLKHGYSVKSCDALERVEDSYAKAKFRTTTKSPLHIAAEFNHYEMIPLLIEAGADITEKRLDYYRTPLEIAEDNCSTEAEAIISAALGLADQIIAGHQQT